MEESLEEIQIQEKQAPFIIITSPIFIKESLTKYVSYTVSGRDTSGDIEVQRRYTEFKELRKHLLGI
jgi:PX domain.